MAKKATPKTATVLRPVKEKLTKSALVTMIAEQNEISRKAASGVLATSAVSSPATALGNGAGGARYLAAQPLPGAG